jgi:hypothetical protein
MDPTKEQRRSVWRRVSGLMGPTKEQRHISCNSQKSGTETPAMIRQAFGEESAGFIRKVQTRRDRWRQARQVMSMLSKEFDLEGQTVNSAYYCDVLRRMRKDVRRLRPELWRQTKWLLHHDNAPSHTLSIVRNSKLPTLLSPLERANLNHWTAVEGPNTVGVTFPSPQFPKRRVFGYFSLTCQI